MCGARLFAVRVILLQRYKVLPACLPDFGSLPTLIQGARNGRPHALEELVARRCCCHPPAWDEAIGARTRIAGVSTGPQAELTLTQGYTHCARLARPTGGNRRLPFFLRQRYLTWETPLSANATS